LFFPFNFSCNFFSHFIIEGSDPGLEPPKANQKFYQEPEPHQNDAVPQQWGLLSTLICCQLFRNELIRNTDDFLHIVLIWGGLKRLID
jgi:hypothetical protein